MPWCPSCKEEYREGFTVCNDCGTELVNELIPVVTENDEEYEKESHLITASNEIEADIIESLLKSYEIPVLKKHEGAGALLNVYMGYSTFGIKIFVPKSKLEEARIIIENKNIKKLEEELEEESEIYVDNVYDKKRHGKAWSILVFTFIPGLVALLIYFAYLLINLNLKK